MSKFLTMLITLIMVLGYFSPPVSGQCPNDVIRMKLINPASGPNIGLEPHGIWADSMFCGRNFTYFYILEDSYLDVHVDGTSAYLHGSAKIIRGGNCLSNPSDTFYFHSTFKSADEVGITISGKDNLPTGTLDPQLMNDWLYFIANDDDSYMHNGTDTIWAPHFFGFNPTVAKFGLQIGYGASGKSLDYGMAWWLTYLNGPRTGMADFSTNLDTVCVPAAPSIALCPDQEILIGLGTQSFAQITSTVSGGIPPYQYEWTNSLATTPDITVSPTTTTVYTLIVTDALNRKDTASHTVTVHNISAGNGQVYMCNNKNNPKTKSVNLNDMPAKLGQGYTLGSCGSNFNLDPGTCGQVVPPENYGPCDCDGRIKELTLVYSGPDNVSIYVYSLQGQTPTAGTVFNNVMSGDTVITRSSDAGLARFGPNTRFEVSGNSNLNQVIHTSCSQEILGVQFGVFFVLGHVDFNNNKCGTSYTPPPPPSDPPSSTCDCEGRIKELTVVYSGPGNVNINVFSLQGQTPTAATSFTNVQTGDTLVAKSSDASLSRFGPNTRFEVSGNSNLNQVIHTSCSQEILGEQFGVFFVLGYVDFNSNSCGTSYTPPSSPPPPPSDPPTSACDCDGRIKELTVVYSGPGNVNINVISLQGQTPTAATSFQNVQTGDTLVAKSSDADLGRFGPNTRFEVVGNSSLNQVIHTSCSQEILGHTFGSFFVSGHTDYNNNRCDVPGPDPEPEPEPEPVCPDGVTRYTLINPASGPNIGLEPHGIWADSMFCGRNFTYFYILENSYLDVSLDGKTAFLHGSAKLIRGGNCLNDPNDTFYFHTTFMSADELGIDISGKDNLPANVLDPQLMDDWIYFVANNDDSYLHNGTDTIWAPHFFGVNPSVAKFGMQIGYGANGKSLDFGMAWWLTYHNGSRTGMADFATNLDTLCVGDSIIPTPPAPPMAPCDCEGRMKEVQVVYSGPNNVNITTKSMQGAKKGITATVFNNVQNGDTLTAKSSDANLDRFGPSLDFIVAGNSGLYQRLHTSCSQDILGNTYGAYYVLSHTDYEDNYCHATLNPMPMLVRNDDLTETGLENVDKAGHQSPFEEVISKLNEDIEQSEIEVSTNGTLEVFPNPFTNQVQLSFYNKSTDGNTVLKVTDALGKVIVRQVISGAPDTWIQRTIEIKGEAGLYILSLENADGLVTKRLIKF